MTKISSNNTKNFLTGLELKKTQKLGSITKDHYSPVFITAYLEYFTDSGSQAVSGGDSEEEGGGGEES